MTTTVTTLGIDAGSERGPAGHNPGDSHAAPHAPGLHVPWYLPIMYLAALGGLAIDALLAASVFGRLFDLDPTVTSILLVIVGVGVAEGATSAAINRNLGQRRLSWGTLGAVLALGVCLAYLRLSEGLVGGGADTSGFAGAPVTVEDETPAIVFMLALFVLSAVVVYSSALKLFVPAREELRRHAKARAEALERLTELGSQLVAIEERLGSRDSRTERMTETLDHALGRVDAREKSLKGYARDAIARAVGAPDAAPLVRAPHEPAPVSLEEDDAEPTGHRGLLVA